MAWTSRRSILGAPPSLCSAATLVWLSASSCAGNAPAAQSPTAAASWSTEPAPAAQAEVSELPQPAPPPAAVPHDSVTSSPASLVVKDAFADPESVPDDIESDLSLVSNVNGAVMQKDGNGFISRVSPEGQVLALKWIDGADPKLHLNAPKGMAISAGVLFVADLDRIRKFDSQSGASLGEIFKAALKKRGDDKE